jgi:hypothetical protein
MRTTRAYVTSLASSSERFAFCIVDA